MKNAIIETGGMQFPVSEGAEVQVPLMDGEVGDKVVFDQVLFADKGEEKLIGTPTVANAQVEGEIVQQGRDDKIMVFHFKRRTTYRKKNGHRQPFTKVKITGMSF